MIISNSACHKICCWRKRYQIVIPFKSNNNVFSFLYISFNIFNFLVHWYHNIILYAIIYMLFSILINFTVLSCLFSLPFFVLYSQEILKKFAQILLAIHHIHAHNILHRDLKTQNIFLSKNRKVVKIGDFGISKVMTKTNASTVSNNYKIYFWFRNHAFCCSRIYQILKTNCKYVA